MATWAITGGSGFLGLQLVRRLLAAGEAVRNLDLVPLDVPGAHGIVGDILDSACALGGRGLEVVVLRPQPFVGPALALVRRVS